jgi:PHS family inorganic phosphate transporter-like MFS transporter
MGFGIVPAMGAVYWRLSITESPRYEMDVNNNIRAGLDSAKQFVGSSGNNPANAVVEMKGRSAVDAGDGNVNITEVVVMAAPTHQTFCRKFQNYFGKWENAKVLIGCSMCWFLLGRHH